jgi:tetratricopeptide (TPR) repeat protein
MKRRAPLILLLLVAISLAAGGGVWYWKTKVTAKLDRESRERIRVYLAANDFISARSSLSGVADPAQKKILERQIRLSEMEFALKYRDAQTLLEAYGEDGDDWVEPDLAERVALVLARASVDKGDQGGYERWSNPWRDKSRERAGKWFLLSVDQLLAKGKQDDAVKLLNSKTFQGQDEGYRQARLALISAARPAEAFVHVEEGLKADPKNGDLLSFRAQLYEAANKPTDARINYVAALLAEPGNPLHRDTLANFYRRTGNMPLAIDTLWQTTKDLDLGVYAFKAWFWSRLTGYSFPAEPAKCTQVKWDKVVQVTQSMKTGPYFNDELEQALRGLPGTDRRPEEYWLRLLQDLKTGNKEEAFKSLDSLPSQSLSLWPGLAPRLRAVLLAQSGQDPHLAFTTENNFEGSAETHSFIRDFTRWARHEMPADEDARFLAWLKTPESLPGLFLASGWVGVALDLGNDEQFLISDASPEWLAYGYAIAIKDRKGTDAAIRWLEKRTKHGPAESLMLGELLIATKQADRGLPLVRSVADGSSPQAGRAKWTLAMMALGNGKSQEARDLVQSNAELSSSARGIEILARAALLDGRKDEAEKLYLGITDQSTDALLFLSKEAYAAKRFADARKWTQILISRFPDEKKFRENLKKINEAEAAPHS